jgi:hypothetical protein
MVTLGGAGTALLTTMEMAMNPVRALLSIAVTLTVCVPSTYLVVSTAQVKGGAFKVPTSTLSIYSEALVKVAGAVAATVATTLTLPPTIWPFKGLVITT